MLRISHSAVVGAWRERESVIRRQGAYVRLLSARRWNEGGADVYLEPEPGEDVLGVRTFGRHPILFLYDPRPIWRELGQQWDVIDIHEEPYALSTAEILLIRWLRRSRAPFVLYSAQNIFKTYPPPFQQLERWALRHVGAISVCNQEASRNARIKGLRGLSANIPLGLDTSRFSPGPPRTDGDGPFTVGYIGRFEKYKGVDVLLDAVATLPGVRVALAGGGPEEAKLRERARRADLEDRVDFRGHLGQHDLIRFYRELDAVVVPSIPTPGWLEQFCRVAVEAMASGIPVIASRSGALPEVVADAGLLVQPRIPADLAAAILKVRDDRELAQVLRQRGLLRATDFSWDRVGRDYHRMYWAIAVHAQSPAPIASADPRPPRAFGGVEVIVVAYGRSDLLEEAVHPISGLFPITIVDNSSDPATKAVAAATGARYLDPGSNLGFGAGVNYALLHRQDPDADVLLLNPDAVVTPGAVRELQVALHVEPGVASVAPAQVDPAGRTARVMWPFPSPRLAWREALGGGRRPTTGGTYVIGSVLMLNQDALADVGAFDERFFLYAEETDWAYRAHRLGWQHRLVDSVEAVHHGGATSSDPTVRDALFHSSYEKYIRKHFGSMGWASARGAGIVGSGIRTVVLRGESRRTASRRLRTYIRGPVRVARALVGPQ